MIRAVLLDHLGLAYSEAEVPDKQPIPQALIWGPEVFVAVDPKPDGTLQYRLVRSTYVIPDTWTRP
jgi:hypothetical protein